jgi:hypothetical protein
MRHFSRPVFRLDLVPLFLETLHTLCLPDWVAVRERLYTQNADHLLDDLILYKEAFLRREALEKRWYCLRKTYPLDKASQDLYQEVLSARDKEKDALGALTVWLQDPPYPSHTEDWNLYLNRMYLT